MNLRSKHIAFCSFLAACLYVTIMITFDSNCYVAQQTLSQGNSIVNYAETQISSQDLPQNTISNLVNICKSPIKKQTNEERYFTKNTSHIQHTLFAYLNHYSQDLTSRIFGNTDIIFPFNYFW